MQFNLNISDALVKMLEAEQKVRRGVELYGQTAGLKLEARAKQDAPWHNRTGNARQTIKGISGWKGADVDIKLVGTGRYVGGIEKLKVGSVNTSAGMSNRFFIVGVAGNMEYSPYLELRRYSGSNRGNYGTYAVLWPTLNDMQSEITRGFANMINHLR